MGMSTKAGIEARTGEGTKIELRTFKVVKEVGRTTRGGERR